MSFHSLAACLAFLLPFGVYGQAPDAPQTAQASLSISCDEDCTWNVDGDQHGVLKKGEEAYVNVLFGAHKVEAKSSNGSSWEEKLEVVEPKREQVRINFGNSSPAEKAQAKAQPASRVSQTGDSDGEIPKFYAQSRQVLLEARVWNKHTKMNVDASWVPKELLAHLPKVEADSITDWIKNAPPPARGLTPEDFQVFDDNTEQHINYFKETDFPGLDTSGQWRYQPTPEGIWGASPGKGPWLEPPSATYLIGYSPPSLKVGECRAIRVTVAGRETDVSRTRYCVPTVQLDRTSPHTMGTYARMQDFSTSNKPGSIEVSMRAFAFRSSGVLTLIPESTNTGGDVNLPAPGFTYVVEVHDAKAPTTVQIAADFILPPEGWDVWHCIDKNPDALYVLGMVYKGAELVRRFEGTYTCNTGVPAAWNNFYKATNAYFLVPTRFDTQIELPPGDYDVKLVLSDGRNLGRTEVTLQIVPFIPHELTVSDVVLSSFVRNASWVPREAAEVSPAPLVPNPLVSRNVQFFPEGRTQLRRGSPLSLYFEIYDPDLGRQSPVRYSLRIASLTSGSLVMNTGPMSASDFIGPGTAVIPIGLKLDTEKLDKGSYQLEVQASDSAGRQSESRRATFTIE